MTTPMERLLNHPMTQKLLGDMAAWTDRMLIREFLAHEARSRHGRKKQVVRWAIQARAPRHRRIKKERGAR